MKQIAELHRNLKEARNIIIDTMVQRGITELNIIPDMDDWLKENDGMDKFDYHDLKCENCPSVTYYDKHGCGYQYDVTKVTLTKKWDDFHFKLEGDGNDIGYDTFYDYEVNDLDMSYVYEAVGTILGLE